MRPDFPSTVHALVETVADREHGAQGAPVTAHDFILRSFRAMPAYLRLPFRVATLGFDAWAIPRHGRPFHRLPARERRRQMERWEASFIGPARTLMRFYVSLALLSLWSGRQADD